ncbi:methyltransferase [Streptomyces sp. NBC_01310]|uniref:methyltransferase n=1 Tax=Streptomyces sp. NBC_01310 TaxID=2903820 RepID=UPI0035B622A8|nr:methyltransferase [Streptomyces sp. NBC_01310]
MKYLVEIEVFAVADDGYRLTPVGGEPVEDDHSLEEYDLRGARAAFDLSLAGLAERLLTGGNGCRTASGETLAEALRTDVRLGGSARAAIEDEARWVAPGVVGAYDWSAVEVLGASGSGAGTVVNALVKEFPGLRVRLAALPSVLGVLGGQILDPEALPRVELVPQSHPVPSGARTLLLCRLLEWLPDEDAVLTLTEAAAALPVDGALVLVLVEQWRRPIRTTSTRSCTTCGSPPRPARGCARPRT